MREIIFRGKCFNTEEWVEGYLGIEVPDELVIQQFSYDEYFESDCIDQHSVKPESVGEYTGLCDKNGKKIFEGDIVQYELHDIRNRAVIKYGAPKEDSFCYGWYLDDNNGNTAFLLCKDWVKNYNCQVIGNIHDNPKLVEG